MTARRIPRWSELAPLLGHQPVQLSPTDRRLSRAHTIGDLRTIARRRTPRAVFDYTDGAAEAEISLRRARAAFRSVEFRPGVLRDVSRVDPATTILGRRSALPFVLAPTGFTRMMHHEGERAVVRVADRRGIPYALSTMGTTSLEDVAAAAPDAAVAGSRLRDVRNGLTIPPSLTLRTIADAATHPQWWVNLLTTEPLTFASLTSWRGTVADLANAMFDPNVGPQDLSWLRQSWGGKLVVKGISTVEDARMVVDHGADAIVLSNHGGRQLDRAPSPLHVLPGVVEAVGDRTEVFLDTGITSGGDIVAALALGATACLVGRAYLYGLMAGGERGVERAVQILDDEIVRTMALVGVSRVADLNTSHVVLRP